MLLLKPHGTWLWFLEKTWCKREPHIQSMVCLMPTRCGLDVHVQAVHAGTRNMGTRAGNLTRWLPWERITLVILWPLATAKTQVESMKFIPPSIGPRTVPLSGPKKLRVVGIVSPQRLAWTLLGMFLLPVTPRWLEAPQIYWFRATSRMTI